MLNLQSGPHAEVHVLHFSERSRPSSSMDRLCSPMTWDQSPGGASLAVGSRKASNSSCNLATTTAASDEMSPAASGARRLSLIAKASDIREQVRWGRGPV